MTIYICDDDLFFAEMLEKDLHALLDLHFAPLSIKVCDNGRELLTLSKQAIPDLVFLDIDMPEMDGFTLAQQLCNLDLQLLIVFVTSLNELVFQSFQYQPFWFLRKDHMEELSVIVEKLVQKSEKEKQMLIIKISSETRGILLSEILYFESSGHYVNLYLSNEQLRYKEKISSLEQELMFKGFVRIHMGYLVNCRHIRQLTNKQVVLDNDCALPISRSHLQKTQHAFMQYMRSIR